MLRPLIPLPHIPDFYDPKVNALENITGKGEKAHNKGFSTLPKTNFNFSITYGIL